MGAAHSALIASGALFRLRIGDTELAHVAAARRLFQATSIIPALIYYFSRFSPDAPAARKFPATISFTIRRGAPWLVHHALWGAGWWRMWCAIRSAGDARLQAFAAQMFATGVLTTGVFALGQSPLRDTLHAACAGLYMIDHHVLIHALDVQPAYSRTFYVSFACMAAAIGAARRAFAWDESASDGRPSRALWLLELVIMVCENLLFYSFVWGMCSGLAVKQRSVVTSSSSLASTAGDSELVAVDSGAAALPAAESEIAAALPANGACSRAADGTLVCDDGGAGAGQELYSDTSLAARSSGAAPNSVAK